MVEPFKRDNETASTRRLEGFRVGCEKWLYEVG
jgi:hypothetical protein